MVLATREEAQYLSDAVQGDGDPLSVLQEFEKSPRPTLEELKTFEYEVLEHLADGHIAEDALDFRISHGMGLARGIRP